jgi:hypothetical protein
MSPLSLDGCRASPAKRSIAFDKADQEWRAPLFRRPHLLHLAVASLATGLCGLRPPFAAAQSSEIPTWLQAHVGEGAGQIAQIVLQRARALYLRKLGEGGIRNPCYLAMDATRPNDGEAGHRFYVICEATHSFRAVSSGHGSGRDLEGSADFANGRRCAKNFGNALDSYLTAGGNYVTHDTKGSDF